MKTARRPTAASDGRLTLDPPWLPTRLRRSGAVRAEGRSTARSTAASTAEPGCSSAFRCSSSPSASPARRRCSRRAFRRRSTGSRPRTSPATWRSAGPLRTPGSTGSTGAARWFAQQLTPDGYAVRTEAFTAHIPGQGPVRLRNLVATKPGLSHKTIVVMAHRDDAGTGPGANDNASGTGALVELARTYAPAAGKAPIRLPYTLLFLSTDGAGDGALGAAEFAAHAPERSNVIAVLNLDAIAGKSRPRHAADRRHAPFARFRPRRDGPARAQPGDRLRAGPRQRGAAADRSRVPVQPLRAGAVRRPRRPGGDDHDRRRPARTGLRRHTGAAEPHAARPGRARDPERARRARAGRRAPAGAVELHLPREPDHPRLGDRDRARRGPAALSRGDRRPLRPLPPTQDPGLARAPELSQPPRLLALVRRALRPVLRVRRLARRCAAASLDRRA